MVSEVVGTWTFAEARKHWFYPEMLRIAEHFDVEVVCHTVSAQVQDMWLCQLTQFRQF